MTTRNTIEVNPCFKEQNQSMKCLDDNGYDHDKCELQFENYKTCKKFWGYVQKHRKRNGITPYLPEVQDRERVKNEYLNPQRSHRS